jgi:ATP synthase protein I
VNNEQNGLLKSVRRRRERYQTWLRQGEPSFGRYLAQIGALGWIIVVPTLLGGLSGAVDRSPS